MAASEKIRLTPSSRSLTCHAVGREIKRNLRRENGKSNEPKNPQPRWVAKFQLNTLLGNSTKTRQMNRTLKWILIGACVITVATVIGVSCYMHRFFNDGLTPEQHISIAFACWDMSHSSLTTNYNGDVSPNDPRLSEVIKALNPTRIYVASTNSVMREVIISFMLSSNTPAEYEFSRLATYPKIWMLFGVRVNKDGRTDSKNRRLLTEFTHD